MAFFDSPMPKGSKNCSSSVMRELSEVDRANTLHLLINPGFHLSHESSRIFTFRQEGRPKRNRNGSLSFEKRFSWPEVS